ncbi:MAG TPA: GNAT family N-acetyltransferase [Clostridiales bacterium]|nr:GNAT family N-acetyltransferase [Clostridiales bacterium]
MYTYKILDNIDLNIIHQAFVEAFSDYQVKIDLPFLKFENMVKRRGLIPELSIGAFDNEKLIGFVLNGVRNWNGKLTAYDLGTGVIPNYRKQGITSEILTKVTDLCKENDIESYLLEVLQNNTGAVELYKKQGFQTTREFDCYYLNKEDFTPSICVEIKNVEFLNINQWEEIQKLWDYNPSWQNSIDSINVFPDRFSYSIVTIENKIVGYGVVDKVTGDIPQIAISKEHRNKGKGKSIISDLFNHTEANKLSLINVDCRDVNFKSFLMNVGFVNYVNQYEMILYL